MQNHLEFLSKNQFWTRNVRNWTKSRDLVMSGPAKTCPGGQKYLLQTNGNTFISEIAPFQFLLAIFYIFIRSFVVLSKFIIFYNIIGFTK